MNSREIEIVELLTSKTIETTILNNHILANSSYETLLIRLMVQEKAGCQVLSRYPHRTEEIWWYFRFSRLSRIACWWEEDEFGTVPAVLISVAHGENRHVARPVHLHVVARGGTTGWRNDDIITPSCWCPTTPSVIDLGPKLFWTVTAGSYMSLRIVTITSILKWLYVLEVVAQIGCIYLSTEAH